MCEVLVFEKGSPVEADEKGDLVVELFDEVGNFLVAQIIHSRAIYLNYAIAHSNAGRMGGQRFSCA